ncbi:MAG: hypothetical protein IPP48_05540 [Chitinophagaceae bacterium]|nr:hypothetical protein [Chitinophagaceae bacterium]
MDNCYGIVLKNVKNATLKNLSIHHFGVDNILLDSDFANNDTTYPLLNNIVLLNIKSSFSGRNSISWVGGKNILISNSSFTNAGTGRIATAPAYGMDIEPEGNPKHVLCSNGYFINTIFKDNAGLGFTTGTSIDNPVDALGYGYSYNHYFKNCTVVGRYNSAIHNFINRVTFDGCKFYGNVLNYGSSIDETPPCVFKNCYFSDLYNGEIFKDRKLLNLVLSYKAIISNCVFEKYSSSSTVSYLIEKDPDSYDCTNENVKPIIENCAFYYFIQPTPTLLFASILKKIN